MDWSILILTVFVYHVFAQDEEDGGSNAAIIIAIVAGVLFILLIIGIVVRAQIQRKRRARLRAERSAPIASLGNAGDREAHVTCEGAADPMDLHARLITDDTVPVPTPQCYYATHCSPAPPDDRPFYGSPLYESSIYPEGSKFDDSLMAPVPSPTIMPPHYYGTTSNIHAEGFTLSIRDTSVEETPHTDVGHDSAEQSWNTQSKGKSGHETNNTPNSQMYPDNITTSLVDQSRTEMHLSLDQQDVSSVLIWEDKVDTPLVSPMGGHRIVEQAISTNGTPYPTTEGGKSGDVSPMLPGIGLEATEVFSSSRTNESFLSKMQHQQIQFHPILPEVQSTQPQTPVPSYVLTSFAAATPHEHLGTSRVFIKPVTVEEAALSSPDPPEVFLGLAGRHRKHLKLRRKHKRRRENFTYSDPTFHLHYHPSGCNSNRGKVPHSNRTQGGKKAQSKHAKQQDQITCPIPFQLPRKSVWIMSSDSSERDPTPHQYGDSPWQPTMFIIPQSPLVLAQREAQDAKMQQKQASLPQAASNNNRDDKRKYARLFKHRGGSGDSSTKKGSTGSPTSPTSPQSGISGRTQHKKGETAIPTQHYNNGSPQKTTGAEPVVGTLSSPGSKHNMYNNPTFDVNTTTTGMQRVATRVHRSKPKAKRLRRSISPAQRKALQGKKQQ